MEYELLSLQMRCPPPVSRGLLSPLYPIHTTHMIFTSKLHPVSRPLLLSIRFRSSSSAALRIIERNSVSTDLALNAIENPKSQSSSEWSNSKPLENLVHSDSSSLTERNSSKLGFRVVVESDITKLKWYSEKLRDCALNLCLNEGKAIHGKVIRNRIEPDSHLWVSLINFYAKCRSMGCACRVFDEMPERDVVSWTALIGGLVAQGYTKHGISLFSEMRRENVRPNEYTLATVLKACSSCLDLEFGKQIHAEVIKGGAFSDTYVGSSLVDLYAKCGDMGCAEKAFFSMPEQNAVSWNALLNGYAQSGEGEEVLGLFCRMTETEMKLSQFTLSTVLKGCANSKNLRAGQALHSLLIKLDCDHGEFVSCGLLDMYSKCGMSDDAVRVFRSIKNPDIVTWSAIISCLDQQGRDFEAAEFFQSMRYNGLKPNQFTLSSLISAATDLGDRYYCESIHACVYKHGFESDNLVGNALISMYMELGYVNSGYRVFDSMGDQDIVSWNALLSGFQDDDTCHQGPKIFKRMLLEGLRPNIYTFISILRSCSSQSNVDLGKQVHACLIKDRIHGNAYVGTALIDMYAKCKCLEEAESIFNHLDEKDLFTWTVIISGYAQTHQGEKALHLFRQMQKVGVKANEFTLASCLRACSGFASLENGQQLHSLVIKAGRNGNLFVASAIIDMYVKCGALDDAENYFETMDFKGNDTVLWNTIICGYSKHGEGEKAIGAFKFMLENGVSPDGVTFIGVLSAFSHMGLVEEGEKHFHLMTETHGITPSIDHYACMVDMLGKAGKFNEVESFIEQMKLNLNPLIWQTVLGACKIHGNVELAEKAAEKLFEIEPETDSNYILLANIFAAKQRWNDVSKVRALMSHREVKKEPGCSWVVVDAQTCVFLSQDPSHTKIMEIHRKLEELEHRLGLAGYCPNTDFVLHDVSEREKRKNLFYHSERLALAFALISNIPGKTIRIFKNLRICGDCHEYMKLVSEIVDREIVIRDINFFHHFRNGTCSCKDYW